MVVTHSDERVFVEREKKQRGTFIVKGLRGKGWTIIKIFLKINFFLNIINILNKF
jgi:hypothetical protein